MPLSTRNLFYQEFLAKGKKKNFIDSCGINANYYKQIAKRFNDGELKESQMEDWLIKSGWEKKVTWKKKK